MSIAALPALDRLPNGDGYRGWCQVCGVEHALERTPEALEAAGRLMERLHSLPRFQGTGKMLGVLVGEDHAGEPVELHAFSGMLAGRASAAGFVGPTRSGRATAAAQERTLATLQSLSRQIAAIDVAAAERALREVRAGFDQKIERLRAAQRRGKQTRALQRRALAGTPQETQRRAELERLSQHEGGRLRALRALRREALEPLQARVTERQTRRAELRRARRQLSRSLQHAMHASHGLLNFAGHWENLATFFRDAGGIPTGTGECCAPKLLQEAALRGIRPLGMVEFWWGPAPETSKRRHGEFYPACAEKCAPLLGHLLCGRERPRPPLSIVYADEDLLVVDKPAGLLSVKGRGPVGTDCVETRLELLDPEAQFLRAPHRLDQATSGLLLVARTAASFRTLSGAFAKGRIHKEYRARVSRRISTGSGVIELPLSRDPHRPPRQRVDPTVGRRATTHFQVMRRGDAWSDLRLHPTTGRTHQLRVHCADRGGLDAPILGDSLYGSDASAERMLLHAHRLVLAHPRTGQRLELVAPLPREFEPA